MKSLALTTRQLRPGLMIATPLGWQFMPLAAVLLTIAAFGLAVAARLTVDTIAAEGYLLRLVRANVAHHAGYVLAGVDVLAGVVWWVVVPRGL